MNSSAVILITSIVSIYPPLVGKWKGHHEKHTFEMEFTKEGRLVTVYHNKKAQFNYKVVNDTLIQIGSQLHRTYLVGDTLLRLRPLKVEKDIFNGCY